MGENKIGNKLPRFIKLKDESGEETIHYNTVSKDCPEEVKRYAEKELNETEENKRKGLKKLKTYLKEENLPELGDIYLIAVLRCCKYDMKKSEVKLKKLLNVRRVIIKHIKSIDHEKLDCLISDGFAECLPWTDKHGRPIYIFRPKINLSAYNYEEMAAYVQACFFTAFTYPLPTIKGGSIILNCRSNSPSFFIQVMNEFRKYVGLHKFIPLRVGRVDFVNENGIVHNCFTLIRPLLPSKIVERVAFHGSDLKKLHKIYHPALLPDELGGTLGAVDTRLFKEERFRTFDELKAANSG